MEVCYRYDGSFAGFLTCVFESYVNKEPPAAFALLEGDPTLWPEREIDTHPGHAQRVYRGLGERISPQFRHMIQRAFLTCLPERELMLYTLIRRGFEEGDRVRRDLADPVMAKVTLALQKLATEEDHLKGFVRFSDVEGTLVGEIEPKNRMLPLLAPHFAARFPGERMVLHDRTYHEVFVCAGGRWKLLPAEDFHMGAPGEVEREWRALWRRFYATISIQGRENPKCQDTHMPKRYRHMMTEFQKDEMPALPGKLWET